MERDRLVAAALPETPPSWQVRGGDPLQLFAIRLSNRLLAQGWSIRDAALVLAVAQLSREVGRYTARQAVRRIWLAERNGATLGR